MSQQKKDIIRLIFPVFLVMVLCYGPNLFSQEQKVDTISIEKTEFEPGEDIRINYQCSEDKLPYLWLGIFNRETDDQMMKDNGLSIKILGELTASVLLNAPKTTGNYQARLFSMQSGTVSVHHRLNFEVKKKEDFKDKPGTPKDDIVKIIKVTEKRDLKPIDTPSKTFMESVALEVKKSQDIKKSQDVMVYSPCKDTGFNRKEDGFQILNYPSRWLGNAGCAGFVVFAKYYFEEYGGGLGEKYMKKKFGEKIFRRASEKPYVYGQHIIATRAVAYIEQSSDLIIKKIIERMKNSLLFDGEEDKKNLYAILKELCDSGKPVLLGLHSFDKSLNIKLKITGSHAVLAFAYNTKNEETIISVYDPNSKKTQEIRYNHNSERFDDYHTYSEIFLLKVNEDNCKRERI